MWDFFILFYYVLMFYLKYELMFKIDYDVLNRYIVKYFFYKLFFRNIVLFVINDCILN